MAISSINEYYNSIINSALSKIKNSTASSNTDSTASNNSTDKLDLNSSTDDLAGFLNYNASGNYNSLPNLADFLNNSNNGGASDLFGLEGITGMDNAGQLTSLADALGKVDSTDSSGDNAVEDFFSSMAEQSMQYNNLLISQALDKLNQAQNQTKTGSVDKTDKTDASSGGTKTE